MQPDNLPSIPEEVVEDDFIESRVNYLKKEIPFQKQQNIKLRST